MKWFTDFIPFLAPYPFWVKWLIIGWILFTGGCVGVLIITNPQATANTAHEEDFWLKINRVEIFNSTWTSAGVRVIAEVNGNTFTYPSVGGAQWVMVGPGMSPGLFKLPPSEVFQITFSMNAKHQAVNDETKFVSQRIVVIRKDQVPKTDSYAVHELGAEKMRGVGIAAEISFSVLNQPN